jgi:hypothetical protein
MVKTSLEDSGVKSAVTRATKTSTKVPAMISSKLSIGRISPEAVRSLAKASALREANKI